MSVFSLSTSPSNPVTKETLENVAERLGISIAENEKEDYLRLLAVYHESVDALMSLPGTPPLPIKAEAKVTTDYIPQVDEKRFRRQNIHFPTKEYNPLNAWAWKCDIQDNSSPETPGLLAGRTLAVKDNIAVKDVPMLMGTDMVKGYIPVIPPQVKYSS